MSEFEDQIARTKAANEKRRELEQATKVAAQECEEIEQLLSEARARYQIAAGELSSFIKTQWRVN